MRALASWIWIMTDALRGGWRTGVPALCGDPKNGVIFILDGIGGVLFIPVNARVAFREAGLPHATCIFDWHHGLRGEFLGDLCCLRRNRAEAARLARMIREFRRVNPGAPVHVLAYSGGTGVAVFAAERLGPRARIDTLVLCCSALSPAYPLASALRNVGRCYAFASARDVALLGLGTTLFGTIDRRFGPSAGLVGFRREESGARQEGASGGRFRQIWWNREMRHYGNHGNHVGSGRIAFIRDCIAPLLADGAGRE
jgi:pimeloyl-ACP methyl ester carboxylesterase